MAATDCGCNDTSSAPGARQCPHAPGRRAAITTLCARDRARRPRPPGRRRAPGRAGPHARPRDERARPRAVTGRVRPRPAAGRARTAGAARAPARRATLVRDPAARLSRSRHVRGLIRGARDVARPGAGRARRRHRPHGPGRVLPGRRHGLRAELRRGAPGARGHPRDEHVHAHGGGLRARPLRPRGLPRRRRPRRARPDHPRELGARGSRLPQHYHPQAGAHGAGTPGAAHYLRTHHRARRPPGAL